MSWQPTCADCRHWTSPEAHRVSSHLAGEHGPEWVKAGLCRQPDRKMHPLMEEAVEITTLPDFGCVQWEVKP